MQGVMLVLLLPRTCALALVQPLLCHSFRAVYTGALSGRRCGPPYADRAILSAHQGGEFGPTRICLNTKGYVSIFVNLNVYVGTALNINEHSGVLMMSSGYP